MGIASLFFISILVLCLLFDTLLGLLRGRNRSLLRLGLVALSVVIALLIYKPITNAILDIDIDGYSISSSLLELSADAAGSFPETISNLIIALIQIIIGIFVFIAVFLVIKLFTWLVAFPILKIFVRPEEKKNRGLGALIGFAQGFLVAIIICGCLSGFVAEAGKITQIEISGEKIVEIPEELGIDNYASSPTASFFDITGGWVFDIVSSTKVSGTKVSVASISNTTTTVLNISNEMANAFSNLDNLDTSNETEAMKTMGNALIDVGTAIEELDDDSKKLVSDLLDDVAQIVEAEYGEFPEELDELLESIVDDVDVKSAGEALNAVAKYVEGEPVTQNDVDDIVKGIANNMHILQMIGITDLSVVEAEADAEMFKTAIENANLTQEDITTLKNLFGLN